MFKDNGRLKPADEQEMANIKGKLMVCPLCGKKIHFTEVEFGSTKCPKCGNEMADYSVSSAKLTGKK